MKKLAYLQNTYTGVWDEAALAFNRSLSQASWPGVTIRFRDSSISVTRLLAKLKLLRNLNQSAETAYLSILMGPAEYALFPVCYFAECLVYCFDCWPQRYAWWESFFRRHRIRVAFFSARQSAAYFTRRIPGMQTYWLPEAADPEQYDNTRKLTERTIDVLELGRRYDRYHEKIVQPLRERGKTHLFEKQRGQIIFPTRQELIAGLGNTRVSLCFPGSLTHPARCAQVETVTHRYFEAIASKCLLLGHCPDELEEVFGFNPVIEADLTDPAGQLEEILHSPEKYEELINRNYQRLLEVGTWAARTLTLTSILHEQGYIITPSEKTSINRE